MIPTTPAHARYLPFSCPNPACVRFNRAGEGHIAQRSWTGQDQHIERVRCRPCRQECSARRGTLMEATKLAEATMERVLQCQRWGVCDTGTADICEVDLKTVQRFQNIAAQRAQAHHEQVTRALQVEAVHLDEMPSTRREPHVEWRHTAIAMRRRVVLWGHWGERTHESAAPVIAQVVARLGGLPVWLRAGWRAYPAALWPVLGRVSRRRRQGRRGRHPTPRRGPPQDRFDAQVVKVHDGTGKLRQVVSRVVDGGPCRFVIEMASRGRRPSIQTAFMARWDGTRRGLCAPLRRRTRCGSARQRRHQARVWLVVDLDTFGLPQKSLRQQGRPRTPAMAIGLAEHVWSSRDYRWDPVPPDPLARQLMQQRVKELVVPAVEAGSPMFLFSGTTATPIIRLIVWKHQGAIARYPR